MSRLALFFLVLALPCVATACCMVPSGYAGDVDQARQEVVIVHRNGHQEMAIRVLPYFKDAAENPDQLTWILTLPATPTGFREADPAVFDVGRGLHDRLFALARQQWNARTNFTLGLPGSNEAAGDAKASGLDIGQTIKVGPYTITPVKALGAEALTELNVFLTQRGFPAEDAEHLKYFVENNFTFLCIHFRPPAGRAAQLDLPALQVGFDCKDAYYPGKFSSRQGNFALSLTMLSDQPLAVPGLTLNGQRLKIRDFDRVPLHNLWSIQPLPPLLADLAGKEAAEVKKWYVNRVESAGVNPMVDGAPAIAGWADDVFFPVGTMADELPGFWYYGDLEISFAERVFREHALFIFVGGAAAMFALLLWKGRQNRRRLQQANSKA